MLSGVRERRTRLEEAPVASLADRFARWLNTPQGQKARAKAEKITRDPKNRERLTGLANKIQRKR
jgi:hypothetical protein